MSYIADRGINAPSHRLLQAIPFLNRALMILTGHAMWDWHPQAEKHSLNEEFKIN